MSGRWSLLGVFIYLFIYWLTSTGRNESLTLSRRGRHRTNVTLFPRWAQEPLKVHIQLVTQRGRCVLGTGCCFTSFERQIPRTPSHLARRSLLYTLVQQNAAVARGNYFLPRRRKAMVVSPRIRFTINYLREGATSGLFRRYLHVRADAQCVRDSEWDDLW